MLKSFFFETMIDEGKCVAKGDAINWPQHARKKEARNEHDGIHKQSLTLSQARICTAVQNSLPKPWDATCKAHATGCNEEGSAAPTNQLL